MLERIAPWRHVVVAGVALGAAGLGFAGVVGERALPERFDAKHVTVTPVGDDGLRIREVIDQDFGSHERRGHERIIPTDFGTPTDITASSPDAPDDLHVLDRGRDVRIRIGDPDVTITGQHRYVLEYTLPEARLSEGRLALDVIGTAETLRTDRFEVVVTGLELDGPLCNVGRPGARGGCELVRDDSSDVAYRVVFEPLQPGQGITIGGEIVGRPTPADVPVPDVVDRRSEPNRMLVGSTMAVAGLLAAAGVHVWAVRRGRNEVFAGGAADAAFGSLPAPDPASSQEVGVASDRGRTTHVTDRRLAQLTTIEFAPPDGLEPWQGAALVDERMSDATVSAWFSGMAAAQYLTLTDTKGTLTITPGPKIDEADAGQTKVFTELFRKGPVVTLDGYDSKFASVWNDVKRAQDAMIRTSGWWKHLAPQASMGRVFTAWFLGAVVLAFLAATGAVVLAFFGLFANLALATAFAVIVSASIAFFMYSTLLPARSATGSALALRTASFKRFLEASEGQHVEWAWERGVVREYSAWAVALGAATAWRKALQASGIPDAEIGNLSAPLLMHTMASSVAATHTAPSESSGSGSSGGGFSGGSVGGGGGGGSSGSW